MTFELAPVDGLNDEELKEMANVFAAKCQKAAQQTVKNAIVAGNALNELKSRAKHGEWRAWLRTNFDYSTVTAFTYMTLAANVKRLTFEPPSIRAALKAIAEETAEESDEPPVTPRAERVTGRVAVAKPVDESPAEPAKETVDVDNTDENAVPQEPKTNTRHSKATAKAKEADRPAPPVVTPVIVEEPEHDPVQEWIENTGIVDVVSRVIEQRKLLEKPSGDKTRLAAARALRKHADILDPPFIGAPSIEAVEAWAAENRLHDFDADKFFNHYELAGWKYGKAKTPIKDWKRAAANAYAGGKGWAVDGANRLPF